MQVEKYPIFVEDGNIYSTAGSTAGIDMALVLVEEDLGHAAASSIARELVLYMRRQGNEAQRSSILEQRQGLTVAAVKARAYRARKLLSRRLTQGAAA